MFRSGGLHQAHTVLWRQPRVVVQIIMIVLVLLLLLLMATPTMIGCFLCAPYYSKHFTDPNSFNLYNSTAGWVLLLSPFYN